MTATYRWDALSPDAAGALFADFGAPWWVAGGWALDLFLGRQTRDHGDIDLAVLRADQDRLQAHLAGWDVHVADDGVLTPWPEGDWLVAPRHQFWVRREPHADWSFEVLLEDHRGGDWRFRRHAAVTMPLRTLGRRSADGIPFIAPEVALLYKAARPGVPQVERNELDFAVAAPALDAGARAWLRDALGAAYGDHPWVEKLR